MAPKKKQEKMNLGAFLADQSLGSWADEMDAQPLPSASSNAYSVRNREGGDRGGDRDMGDRRSFTQPSWENARSGSGMGGGMGGAMGAGSMRSGVGDRNASYDERPRFNDREQLPFPTRPPYTAHLGNLAYDVSQTEIEGFLSDCQVTSVRIVEDKFDHKPKGFGYVEFSTPEGLKAALAKSESSFMGRNIKISIAEPPKDRPEQTRDFTDWSRKGPLPDLPQQGRQPSNRGFSSGRNFDERSDAGSERGGSRRPAFFEEAGKTRDFGNWERKGPLSPAPGAGPPMRDGGRLREAGPEGERTGSPSWGEGKADGGSRPPRREFDARPIADRAPTAAEQDTQWRSKMQPDAPSPVATPEASTPASPAAPKERPRLNLAKRTVSTTDPEGASPAAGESKASPFGAARPIDTAARDREVEEKHQLAIRQKQETDQKARDEKTAQETAARAARAERADRGQAQEEDKVSSPTGKGPSGPPRRPSRQQNGAAKPQTPKENGDAAPQKERPNFSILSHEDDAAAEEEREGAEDAVDAPANGAIADDKETKPQEVVQEVTKDASGGATQGGTAEAMEADGWSTVAAKPKKTGRGGQRALAS
ncbi:Eukaryotic translation initiation factor 4B [Teratosphaeriaceae sp. CCFEE 6253]|nr:Eukaryotic translation initiation factor 4B [Teratosphaeriaceae sp. CCFEE 6253]